MSFTFGYEFVYGGRKPTESMYQDFNVYKRPLPWDISVSNEPVTRPPSIEPDSMQPHSLQAALHVFSEEMQQPWYQIQRQY